MMIKNKLMMTKKDFLVCSIILLLGTILGWFLKTWLHTCSVAPAKVITKTVSTKEIKTKSSIDTVYVPGPIRYITSQVTTTVLDSNLNQTKFKISEPDLTAEHNIVHTGKILSNDFSYSVVQKIINKVDSVFINSVDCVYVEKYINIPNKHKFFLGTSIAPTNLKHPNVNFTWMLKNNFQILYEYRLNLNTFRNSEHSLGLKIPLGKY
jgi:hypothetical protein